MVAASPWSRMKEMIHEDINTYSVDSSDIKQLTAVCNVRRGIGVIYRIVGLFTESHSYIWWKQIYSRRIGGHHGYKQSHAEFTAI